MGFFRQLLGLRPAKVANSPPIHSQALHSSSSQAKGPAATPDANRRELLRLVLRNTLNRQGIPLSWVGAEMVPVVPRGRAPGIHLRLLIKHWDPRLLAHAIGLQNKLIVALMAFDPLASNWLMGISWQFALPNESDCPPLPHPGSWTADLRAQAAAAAADTKVDLPPATEPHAAAPEATQRMYAKTQPVDVNTQPMYAKTQPVDLKTQPMYMKTQPVSAKTQPVTPQAAPLYLQTQPMDLADLPPPPKK